MKLTIAKTTGTLLLATLAAGCALEESEINSRAQEASATDCSLLRSWASNDWRLSFSAGEIIEHEGERYIANVDVSYPNAECSPESPTSWCSGWFSHLGACGEASAPVESCTDGLQNQDETDVDCGGSCPVCETPPEPQGTLIPAKIEAENFSDFQDSTSGHSGDCGSGPVDQQLTDDLGGGCNVGWTTAGEWLDYEIEVPEDGEYDIALRLAAKASGQQVALSIGSEALGSVVAPGEGWQSWQDRSLLGVPLKAGAATVRLTFVDGATNLNWLSFSKAAGETPSERPEPEGDGWIHCAAQGDSCSFSGVQEVAIGNAEGFTTQTQVDEVLCSPEFFGQQPSGQELNCYVRPSDSDCTPLRSVDELREALSMSNRCFRMKAGTYTVDELHEDSVTVMYAEGSNSTFDLTGATIITPVRLLSEMNRNPIHAHAAYKLHGDNLTFINGSFENTYPAGMSDEIDFTTYNAHPEYHPARQMTEFRIAGNNIRFTGTSFIIRGSYPYGYGDMLGKGSGASVLLKKHAALQVTGDGTVFDGVYVQVLAFGHGIFMQGADNTTVMNSVVEGAVRLGADMYQDGPGSLGDQFDYAQQSPDWFAGEPIDPRRMYNLTEDGIRAYTQGTKLDGTTVRTGSITVLNTLVKNMRGCVTTPLAAGDVYVENTTVEGCTIGYALPNDGVIVSSRGDASYGPLYHSTYDNRRNHRVELELLDGPPATGDHALMLIAGSGHEISLSYEGSGPESLRPLRVGDTGARWEGQAEENSASGITLTNETAHPVTLTNFSSNNICTSEGLVSDYGAGNTINEL